MCIYFIYTQAINKKIERHKNGSCKFKNQVTVNNNQPFEDRSDLLFAQMNFIAMANKQALHLI